MLEPSETSVEGRRVLIAAPFYPPHVGGVERYSANLAHEFSRRGWSVDVIACAVGPNTSSDFRVGPSGERIFELDARTVAGRLPFPRPTGRNRRILDTVRASHPDLSIIQTHLFLSGLVVAFRVSPGRTIWINHGSGHVPGGTWAMDRVIAAYEHLLSLPLRWRVDAIASVSQEASTWLRHLGIREAPSIGNAVERVAPPRAPRNPGPLRLLYAGRLEPGKGADVAIAVARRLGSDAGTELTICGDGSLRPDVERLVSEAGIRIHYLGPLSHENLLSEMRAADVFLYPSSYPEGFPTVLLEAGAQGCPVVTYPVAGARELLADGGGWIVEDEDAAADVLRMLETDPTQARQAGERLRLAIQDRFTWARVADRLEGL